MSSSFLNRDASLRILDANLNRSFEALRTLEDIARFSDFESLQHRYKELRHTLRNAASNWDSTGMLASRHAASDVGKDFKLPTETQRSAGLIDIASAAAGRIQESLRSLEEIAKFASPASSPQIEAIRYQVYDLNAAMLLKLKRDIAFLQAAKLYVLADCELKLPEFVQRIEALSRGGVDLIQIRDKTAEPRSQIDYALAARNAVDETRTRIIMNDRADLAVTSGAYGIHVGQTDLSVEETRRLVPNPMVIGLSTHDLAQIEQAIQFGADYIGCGPTFPSQTKLFSEFSGLDFLRSAAERLGGSGLPAFAIGGIHLANVAEVVRTGFRRVAVSQALWHSTAPENDAKRFVDLLTA
ncbi:MAG: thiamine phosphate synthase [Pirellula sp.]|jgi:thiamine-phosphate pyrophosphorylase|nr:thiamine phosphate synthase [Pirellula sp.]